MHGELQPSPWSAELSHPDGNQRKAYGDSQVRNRHHPKTRPGTCSFDRHAIHLSIYLSIHGLLRDTLSSICLCDAVSIVQAGTNLEHWDDVVGMPGVPRHCIIYHLVHQPLIRARGKLGRHLKRKESSNDIIKFSLNTRKYNSNRPLALQRKPESAPMKFESCLLWNQQALTW